MRVRTAEKREAILDAATEAFLELGFERTSMNEIVNRLGGSKATLYGYFATKEQLFMQVIAHKMGQVGPALAALPERAAQNPEEVLTDFGVQYLKSTQTAEARALKRVIQSYLSQSEDIAQQFWAGTAGKLLSLVGQYLTQAVEAGRLVVDDPDVASKQLLCLLEAEFAWMPPKHRASANARSLEAATERAVKTFLSAFGAAKPAKGKRKSAD